jgi:hypothetical protein
MSEDSSLLTRDALITTLKSIFRPASPTIDRKLFKGRDRELGLVLGAIADVGMHAVIYGERGVGKTSLGNMAREAFAASRQVSLSVRLACSAEDTFASVWARLPAAVVRETDLWDPMDAARLMTSVDRVGELLVDASATPDGVTRALHLLGARVPTLIIIDEFDRLRSSGASRLFADLIKSLADDPIPATLLLIGVADDVNSLVEGHGSIDRSLRQVHMPRMKRTELAEVVVEGVAEFNRLTGQELTLDGSVVQAIVHLSQGFPYYTHLLASTIVERAIRESIEKVNSRMVMEALFAALDAAAQSIRSTYAEAVQSTQNAHFEDTLLACALAKVDVTGYFAPGDVVAPLEQITSTRKTTAHFHTHLKKFSSGVNPILETKPTNHARYRFADPLMKPFVLMTGIRDKRWDLDTVKPASGD